MNITNTFPFPQFDWMCLDRACLNTILLSISIATRLICTRVCAYASNVPRVDVAVLFNRSNDMKQLFLCGEILVTCLTYLGDC